MSASEALEDLKFCEGILFVMQHLRHGPDTPGVVAVVPMGEEQRILASRVFRVVPHLFLNKLSFEMRN